MRPSSFWIKPLSVGVLLAACSTSDQATSVGLGDGCVLDSDCKSPLTCAFARCHDQCEASRDCPTGERCVHGSGRANVCQLLDERACEYASDCPLGQLCAVDGQCRDECAADVDCVREQVCIARTCADPSELVDGGLPTTAPTEGVPCLYDSECPGGMHCKKGSCVFDCVRDADCPTGDTCVDHLCHSLDGGAECTPGEQPACACPDGGAGYRVCGPDAKYGPCVPCMGGPGGAGGASSSSSAGGSGAGGSGVGGAVAGSSASTGVGGGTATGSGGATSSSSSAVASSSSAVASSSSAVASSSSAVASSSSAVASSSSGGVASSSSAVASSSSGGVASSSSAAASSSSGGVASSSSAVASSGSSGVASSSSAAVSSSSSGTAGASVNTVTSSAAGVGGFGGGMTIKDATSELSLVATPDDEPLLFVDALPWIASAYVGVGEDGNPMLAGALSMELDIDGATLATDGDDLVVARLGRGAPAIESYPASGVQFLEGAALDDRGTLALVVGCAFCSGLDLGRAAPNVSVTYLTALDALGRSSWRVPISTTGPSRAAAVVSDGADGFVVVGTFAGTLEVGGQRRRARGPQEIYLLGFDGGGELTWVETVDAGPSVSISAAAGSADGSLVVAGTFEGELRLGGSTLVSAGKRDGFVARLGRGGYVRRFGGALDDDIGAVALAPDGVVAIAGTFQGDVEFADGPRRSNGRGDAFVSLLDADGGVSWTRSLGGPGDDAATAVRIDGGGDVVVAGHAGSGADFSAARLTAAGGTDAFVAKIERSGAPRFTRIFGNEANQFVDAIATGPRDEIWVTISSTGGAVDFGTGPLEGTSFLFAL